MNSHRVDGHASVSSAATRYERRATGGPRVFALNELDGFYVDTELDRAVHVTFEAEDVIVIDVFDSARAAYSEAGETVGIVEINLRTGRAKFFAEGR